MFHSFTLTAMVLLPIYQACSIILVKSVFPFSNVLKQVLLKRATIFLGVPAIYTAMSKAKIPLVFQMVQPRPSVYQRRRASGRTNHRRL